MSTPRGLYARLLGSSWLQVAEPLGFAHASGSTVRGRLRVAHGPGHVARLLARLLHLPRESDASVTRLVITPGVDGSGGFGPSTRRSSSRTGAGPVRPGPPDTSKDDRQENVSSCR